jgi:hypothetical protein
MLSQRLENGEMGEGPLWRMLKKQSRKLTKSRVAEEIWPLWEIFIRSERSGTPPCRKHTSSEEVALENT